MRRFAILDEGFTVENGMLTPTMKTRAALAELAQEVLKETEEQTGVPEER